MAKKSKKESQDNSIPIRVTQAKNLSQREKTVKRSMNEVVPKKKGKKKDGSSTELEKLLSPDGGSRDMTRLDQGNPRRRLLIRIGFIVLGLFAISAAGFFYFTRDDSAFGQNITFAVIAPNLASSGEVVTLQVRYENKEDIDLLESQITMQFPEGFTFQSSIPSSTTTNTWELGTLKAKAGGVLEIKGRLVGDIGQEKIFSGTLSYMPSNFNYRFEEDTSFGITISSSTLSLDIDSPIRVSPDKEFETTISYTNTSQESLDDIKIILDSPASFTLASSDPEAEKNSWEIDRINSDETGEIKISGLLSGNPGDQPQFTVRIGFMDAQGIFKPQAEKSFLVLLIKAGLTLDVTTDLSTAAEWGDTVEYTLTYTNDGDLLLENMQISLELTSETNGGQPAAFIDWDEITTLDGGIIQEMVVVWDAESVEALKEIKPQDSGTFTLTIPLLDEPEVANDSDEEFHILAEARAQESGSEDLISSSEIQETKISTEVSLAAEARYYTDSLEEVGDGPLPPEVGEQTELVIFWNVTNTTNDVEDVVVTATLPTGVKWIGDSTISAGDPLSYNPQTKTVTWKINRIPAGAGNLFPELEAQFMVGVIPTADQVGTFALVLNATSLTSTDVFSGVPRSDQVEALTTNLQSDPRASGSGTVVESTTTNTNS